MSLNYDPPTWMDSGLQMHGMPIEFELVRKLVHALKAGTTVSRLERMGFTDRYIRLAVEHERFTPPNP